MFHHCVFSIKIKYGPVLSLVVHQRTAGVWTVGTHYILPSSSWECVACMVEGVLGRPLRKTIIAVDELIVLKPAVLKLQCGLDRLRLRWRDSSGPGSRAAVDSKAPEFSTWHSADVSRKTICLDFWSRRLSCFVCDRNRVAARCLFGDRLIIDYWVVLQPRAKVHVSPDRQHSLRLGKFKNGKPWKTWSRVSLKVRVFGKRKVEEKKTNCKFFTKQNISVVKPTKALYFGCTVCVRVRVWTVWPSWMLVYHPHSFGFFSFLFVFTSRARIVRSIIKFSRRWGWEHALGQVGPLVLTVCSHALARPACTLRVVVWLHSVHCIAWSVCVQLCACVSAAHRGSPGYNRTSAPVTVSNEVKR